MPGPPTTPHRTPRRRTPHRTSRRMPRHTPHRSRGSWTPRLAGVAVVVVLAGGILGVLLGTAPASHPVSHKHRHPHLSVKVVSVQAVGVIDFGPDDNGRPWQNNHHDHPMMLLQKGKQNGKSVDFVRIPARELVSGTPEWTANQMSDGSEIFVYVPTGQCLSAAGKTGLKLTHCDLGLAQRWLLAARRSRPGAGYRPVRERQDRRLPDLGAAAWPSQAG